MNSKAPPPPAHQKDPLPFSFELQYLHDGAGTPGRPVVDVLQECLSHLGSSTSDPFKVYAVDVDRIEPGRLLRLLWDRDEQDQYQDEDGMFFFLTQAHSLREWGRDRGRSIRTPVHLKENELTIRILIQYGLGRDVCTENLNGNRREPYRELKARIAQVLSRKLGSLQPASPTSTGPTREHLFIDAALRTITGDVESLRRIASLEIGGEENARDRNALPGKIAAHLGSTEQFLDALRVIHQLGNRAHADAETQVVQVLQWPEVFKSNALKQPQALGSIALRRRGDKLLDLLTRDWRNQIAAEELKTVQAAQRAYEVLRDLSGWIAYGAHRWANRLGKMRVLIVDEALADPGEMNEAEGRIEEPFRNEHEDAVLADQRHELQRKLGRIVEAFGGRAEIEFEHVRGPDVWGELQRLLDEHQITTPRDELVPAVRIPVVRMDFASSPAVDVASRYIGRRELLEDYHIILVEVEFRNYFIGPKIVQRLSETLERLASHRDAERSDGDPWRRVAPSIIVLSQSANFHLVQQCLNLGADAYVRKERIYELPMRAVRAHITHRRPEARGQKSNFRILYSLFPEDIAALQSDDRSRLILGNPDDLLDRDWIERLPKADLHTHIGTAIDLRTIEALAFNTVGHLLARRQNEAFRSGLTKLIDQVCATALVTAAKLHREKDVAKLHGKTDVWPGEYVEEAVEQVLPDSQPAAEARRSPTASLKERAQRNCYKHAIDQLAADHPGVNRFEITALLVVAFFMVRYFHNLEAAAGCIVRRWESIRQLATWTEAEEAASWIPAHASAIVSLLERASNDLYGLSGGSSLRDPKASLWKRAERIEDRVRETARQVAERLRALRGGENHDGLPPDPSSHAAVRKHGANLSPPALQDLVAFPREPIVHEHDLLAYLRGAELLGADHLQYPENILLAAHSVAEQMSKENVIYCELRCETVGYTEAGMGAIHATDLLCLALDVFAACLAVRGGWPWTRFNILLGAKRHKEEERFREIVALAEHYLQRRSPGRPESRPVAPDWWRPSSVVGFDLSGDENKEVANAVNLIRPLFVHSAPITIHAGEAATAEKIWQAVYEYGARRIGHGLRLREDTTLMNYCISEGICMELCPISNQATNAFPFPKSSLEYDSDWREYYPLRYYLERGLDVSINTDNRQLHKSNTLTDDYMCAARLVGGLTRWEVLKIVKAGFKHAFLPKREIEVLLRAVESEIYDLVTSG